MDGYLIQNHTLGQLSLYSTLWYNDVKSIDGSQLDNCVNSGIPLAFEP